ncbi:MAG TPA: hypothetical protein VMJ10_18000 [Kofleriaceae bacterium]|nr:hypothetical protein [Kofleriaceae bacterium]
MLVATLVLWASVAYAGGRKRIVVLEFEGPHAEKFHDDLVKLLKKSNTVVPTDKWNGTAEELDAATVTEKNVKKVAKKLKIDGVVTGKIEKRRDEYIVRLKLRAGTSGEIVGNPVDTKADGPHLDGKAARDIKDELVGAIDELEANHGGGGDDDDEADDSSSKKKAKKTASADEDSGDDSSSSKSKKKKKKAADDDDSASSDDDSSSKHGAFSKHADKGGDKVGKKSSDDDDSGDDSSPKSKKKKVASSDDDDSASSAKAKKKKAAADDDDSASTAKAKKASSDDDDSASATKAKKKAKSDDDSASSDDDDSSSHKKAKKKVASGDDDSDNASAEASSDEPGATVADPLAPTERAIDAAVGLSFIARHLSFSYSSALAGPQIPPGYKQSVPVAGAYVDATVYPFDINHNRTDALSHLGIEVMYDRVLRISSQKQYTNQTTNMTATATLATVSEAYGLGAVYRYALGKIALGGRLMYQNQSFLISQSPLPDGSSVDIPNVQYSMVEIGGFARYPLMPKIVIDVDAGFLGVLSAGSSQYYIGNGMEYGKASTYGFTLSGGAEYMLTKNIFLRGQLSLEEISMKFANNSGTLANTRDGDGTTQDVFSAKDMYYGVLVTAGYLY